MNEIVEVIEKACQERRLELLVQVRDHLDREIAAVKDVAPVEKAAEIPQAAKRTPAAKTPTAPETKAAAARVQKFFDAHPGASWRQAFAKVKTHFSSANSMGVCLRPYVTREPAKAGGKKRTLPKARPRKAHTKTLAQAQALRQLEAEALKQAALDGIEFPDDDAREDYIERFMQDAE